jgi:hypothetical protein
MESVVNEVDLELAKLKSRKTSKRKQRGKHGYSLFWTRNDIN